MLRLEKLTIETGITAGQLMENAGKAVFQQIKTAATSLVGKSVLLLVGPGNNGGDGLVIARHLALAHASVNVILTRPRSDDPLVQSAIAAGAHIAVFSEGIVRQHAAISDIVVDCLLGIGSAPPLHGKVAAVLEEIEKCSVPLRVACDIASGIDADTGDADEQAFSADITVAIGPIKIGSVMQPAMVKSGRPIETDIGCPEQFTSSIRGQILVTEQMAASLPERPLVGHKGLFGKVLIVAGSQTYRGAATLACLGAARAGAGIVSLASIEPVIQATAAHTSSITYENLIPHSGAIGAVNATKVSRLIDGSDAVVIGPGLGKNPQTIEFIRSLMSATQRNQRLVVDADALNACSPAEGPLAQSKAELILTPHPGEMARLLGSSITQVQKDRLTAALDASRIVGQTIVLKGAGSIVVRPDGSYSIFPMPVPALSHAGSGDVLAGTIGALLAQGLETASAAELGVLIHSRAGQISNDTLGPAGTIADDLPDAIANVLKTVRLNRLS